MSDFQIVLKDQKNRVVRTSFAFGRRCHAYEAARNLMVSTGAAYFEIERI